MNELNIHRLECALSEILSRKHNAKVTIKFIERDEQNGRDTEQVILCDNSRICKV
jgi:hypothetical protein